MTRSLTVAGGDRLGKTILFAKNQAHAEFIAERFNANYPHYKGEFARVITFKTEYAQSLIDSFSNKEKNPHLAISVDMLDTGIDVPEVVNLVFFKLVRSKTKFWQMVGRGTRLCPDLFGPGQDKKLFYLLDYCENLEYFSQDIPATEGSVADSLGKRLFKARLELIGTLDHQPVEAQADMAKELTPTYGDPATDDAVRRSLADLLQREVAAMNLHNFVVRQRRRLVEKLHPLTGHHRYVFPNARYPHRERPMSDATLWGAFRALDISPDRMTLHGFRAMARTILDEVLGFRPDFIEHQLAHAVRDPNGRAYNRTAFLPERRVMLQAWADYLDQLRSGEEPEAGTHGPGLSHISTSPGIRNADSWLDVPGSPRSGVLRGSAPGPLR